MRLSVELAVLGVPGCRLMDMDFSAGGKIKKQPCPFCGSNEIDVQLPSVSCRRCGATGPDASEEDEACQKWNTPVWECYKALELLVYLNPEKSGYEWRAARDALQATGRVGAWCEEEAERRTSERNEATMSEAEKTGMVHCCICGREIWGSCLAVLQPCYSGNLFDSQRTRYYHPQCYEEFKRVRGDVNAKQEEKQQKNNRENM